MNRLLILAACIAGFGLQSCATIISGKLQTIPVTTTPPGAEVTLKGRTRPQPGQPDSYQTPAKVVLHRKEKNVIICIEKDGYRPAEVRLKRGLNGWTFLGLVQLPSLTIADGATGAARVGGLLTYTIGFILLDVATGGGNKLRPGKVEVVLEPAGSSTPGEVTGPLSVCGNPTTPEPGPDL